MIHTLKVNNFQVRGVEYRYWEFDYDDVTEKIKSRVYSFDSYHMIEVPSSKWKSIESLPKDTQKIIRNKIQKFQSEEKTRFQKILCK